MREIVLREEYEDGSARETLACGHVVYVTRRTSVAERRCLLCVRRPHRKKRQR